MADVYNDDLENDDNDDDDFEADEHDTDGDGDSDLAEEEEGEDEGNYAENLVFTITQIHIIHIRLFQKNHQPGEPKESMKAKKTTTMVNSLYAVVHINMFFFFFFSQNDTHNLTIISLKNENVCR